MYSPIVLGNPLAIGTGAPGEVVLVTLRSVSGTQNSSSAGLLAIQFSSYRRATKDDNQKEPKSGGDGRRVTGTGLEWGWESLVRDLHIRRYWVNTVVAQL